MLCPNCHRLFEKLTELKSKVKQQGLRDFNWWFEHERATNWGTKVNQEMNVIVDLYLEHLRWRNLEVFFQEHIRPKAGEFPQSVCLDLTIVKALPNLQTE